MSGIQRLRVVAALLALGCVVAPGLVRADADTTAPVLQALSFPASVFADEHGANVTVSARITDDASGVSATNTCTSDPQHASVIVFKSPTTQILVAAEFASLGADQYTATVHLPDYAQRGTWTVEHVVLSDCAGNRRTVTPDQLAAAGLPTGFSVKIAVDDTAPPTLTGFTVSPASVDNTSGRTEVTVVATITDNLSGVADETADCGEFPAERAFVDFVSPSGGEAFGGTFRRRSGDVYETTISVRRLAEVGVWKVVDLVLIDCALNQSDVDAARLQTLGLPNSFTVTGIDDRTAPTVATLAIAPAVVDTRAAAAKVEFAARLTDDQTGVSTGSAGCDGPLSVVGVTSPSGEFDSALFVPKGGDDYVAALALPRFAEPGTWAVSLQVADCAGNARVLGPAELAAAGLPSSFRVLPRLYEFGGFMSPLGAGQIAQRNAGSAMAVKFRLGGAQGLGIFDAGFPQVQPIDCATRQPTGAAVPLSAIEWRFQELTDGLYHYKWKSSPDWQNVCRRLTLGFDDGSRYSADVHFS